MVFFLFFFFLRDFCLHKILFRCPKSLYETAESFPQILPHIPPTSYCGSQKGFFQHRLKTLIQIKTYCTARYSDTNTNIALDFDRNILQSSYPNAFLKTACVTEGGTWVVGVTCLSKNEHFLECASCILSSSYFAHETEF